LGGCAIIHSGGVGYEEVTELFTFCHKLSTAYSQVVCNETFIKLCY
jgi:hypothetical protein